VDSIGPGGGAIATGAVDIIAPVEEMPAHLLRLEDIATDLARHDAGSGSLDAMRLTICDIFCVEASCSLTTIETP
jgi:hypothetical protein